MIEAEQAAETFVALDRLGTVFVRGRDNKSAAETLVRSLPIVVPDILPNGHPQMRFTEQDEPVQTFTLDRQHEPLRISVQVYALAVP